LANLRKASARAARRNATDPNSTKVCNGLEVSTPKPVSGRVADTVAGYKGLEPVKEIVKDFILLAQKLEALGFRYKNGQVYILKQYR
jgi:hypothetical protein